MRILCYGDSNTWGYDPATQTRFDERTRWTRVLAAALGAGHEFIEEGLNGRTTVWDDPVQCESPADRNGLRYLRPCLASHTPLDGVVLMLGTNDLKQRYAVPASDIAKSVQLLATVVLRSEAGRAGRPPKLLLVAPPPLAPLTPDLALAEMFGSGEAKSRRLGELYAAVAAELGCAFFDAGSVIRSSPIDGIHFEADQHALLGAALAEPVRALVGH